MSLVLKYNSRSIFSFIRGNSQPYFFLSEGVAEFKLPALPPMNLATLFLFELTPPMAYQFSDKKPILVLATLFHSPPQ